MELIYNFALVTITQLYWHLQKCNFVWHTESIFQEATEFSKDCNHELVNCLWNGSDDLFCLCVIDPAQLDISQWNKVLLGITLCYAIDSNFFIKMYFSQNAAKRHPIAHLWGQSMACICIELVHCYGSGHKDATVSLPGPVFCLLLGVSSDRSRPITGQVTLVTWPVIGWA